MSQPLPGAPESQIVDGDPPVTGLPAVDDALAGLADLAGRPVAEHHDALAATHEALHGELHSPPAPSEP